MKKGIFKRVTILEQNILFLIIIWWKTAVWGKNVLFLRYRLKIIFIFDFCVLAKRFFPKACCTHCIMMIKRIYSIFLVPFDSPEQELYKWYKLKFEFYFFIAKFFIFEKYAISLISYFIFIFLIFVFLKKEKLCSKKVKFKLKFISFV